VPQFELQNGTILDALWKLARSPAPFGFGFEQPLRSKFANPSIPLRRFSLSLRRETVRQILSALCRADPTFAWSVDGRTVNVFPRSTMRDPAYLMNRRIPTFVLRGATDIQGGLLAIHGELPPPQEQLAILQAGGSDPYPPKPWTVTYKDLTVRQVINRLAAHGGACAVWLFGGARDFRTFGFFNTNLCGWPASHRSRGSPR
jgi:hypothetical protein